MYAVPFTIERGRAALAAILSAFETPPHLGNKSRATCSFITLDIHRMTFYLQHGSVWLSRRPVTAWSDTSRLCSPSAPRSSSLSSLSLVSSPMVRGLFRLIKDRDIITIFINMSFLVYTAHQNNGEGGSGNCQTRTARQELFHPSDASSTERQFSFQALAWCRTFQVIFSKCCIKQQKISDKYSCDTNQFSNS